MAYSIDEGTVSDIDIRNQAKRLVKDIDEIIKCLETTHINSRIAGIIGLIFAGIGTAIGVLAAVAALIVPEGVVATFGTGFSLTGAATLLGASVFEGINERRKLKTIQKQMEILKKHIPAYMLYSDMTDAWFIGTITRKVIGYGRDIFTAITKVLDAMLIARYSSATSAKNETLLVTSRGVGDFRSILYSLYTERKGFFQGEPTSEVIKILKVLQRELVHIAWVVGCRCQAETQGLSRRSAHEAFDKPDCWE